MERLKEGTRGLWRDIPGTVRVASDKSITGKCIGVEFDESIIEGHNLSGRLSKDAKTGYFILERSFKVLETETRYGSLRDNHVCGFQKAPDSENTCSNFAPLVRMG